MSKYKAPKGTKKGAKEDLQRALPCMFIVVAIFGLIMLLFYWVLKSSS